MHSSLSRRAAWAAVLALLPMTGLAQPAPADAAFLKGNAAAMDRMMAAMSAKPSGDVDRDFVGIMRPHHQGAIDMAQVYLRWGHNEQLRRIAQEIIVEQQQEIAAMNLAVGEALPRSAPAPTSGAAVRHMDHN